MGRHRAGGQESTAGVPGSDGRSGGIEVEQATAAGITASLAASAISTEPAELNSPLGRRAKPRSAVTIGYDE